MKTLLLHIGLPKCGSTTFQKFLELNSNLLSARGLAVPGWPRGYNALELAIYALPPGSKAANLRNIEPSRHEDFKRSLRAQLKSSTEEWSILSSKHLSSRIKSPRALENLAELLSSFRVIVHIFVKPQWKTVPGFYSTWLRDGRTTPFQIDEHLLARSRHEYDSIHERWSKYFPDLRWVHLQGDRDIYRVFETFDENFDISEYATPQNTNKSLSAAECEFLRQTSRKYKLTARQASQIARAIEGSGIGPPLGLSSSEELEIYTSFRESNANFERIAGIRFEEPKAALKHSTMTHNLSSAEYHTLHQRILHLI